MGSLFHKYMHTYIQKLVKFLLFKALNISAFRLQIKGVVGYSELTQEHVGNAFEDLTFDLMKEPLS